MFLVLARMSRDADLVYSRYLLVDSRPRKIMLALPTMLPTPLLSTALDTFFNTFQAPTVSLMAEPMLTTVAAGLRSALIVNVSWDETVVTAVFEYREVLCRQSIRASRHLQTEMQKVLANALHEASMPTTSETVTRASEAREVAGGLQSNIGFEECEDIVERLAWCKPFKADNPYESTDALSTVKEEDELQPSVENLKAIHDKVISIPMSSTSPPINIALPFSSLAEPCEISYFGSNREECMFDDEELPIHWLVYTSLLKLPVDQRAMCMARLIFSGGGSNLPGLRDRVFHEVQHLIDTRGWSPVKGKAIAELENNPKLRAARTRQSNNGPTALYQALPGSQKTADTPQAMDSPQESDPIEARLRAEAARTPTAAHGVLRVVESMGAWAGASLLAQLRIPAVSIVEREQWLQHGAAGAAKSGEITSTSVRQSIGPSGLRAGTTDRLSWTLGPWG